EIRRYSGSSVIVLDRAGTRANLEKIEWYDPGQVTLEVTARDPNEKFVKAKFSIFFGAELRLQRTALSATSPILEVEVGGELTPDFLDGSYGDEKKLPVLATDFDSNARILRLQLSPLPSGDIESISLSLKWPNG